MKSINLSLLGSKHTYYCCAMESRDVISATQPENIRTNPVGNEFITQSRLGCDRSRTIFTIFDVRCAIIRTLGVEISRNDIKDRLAPLVGWKCAEASLTDNQFEHMVSIISTERNLKHSRMLYSQFDRGCKGFVTYIDFINVRYFLPYVPQES